MEQKINPPPKMQSTQTFNKSIEKDISLHVQQRCCNKQLRATMFKDISL